MIYVGGRHLATYDDFYHIYLRCKMKKADQDKNRLHMMVSRPTSKGLPGTLRPFLSKNKNVTPVTF